MGVGCYCTTPATEVALYFHGCSRDLAVDPCPFALLSSVIRVSHFICCQCALGLKAELYASSPESKAFSLSPESKSLSLFPYILSKNGVVFFFSYFTLI